MKNKFLLLGLFLLSLTFVLGALVGKKMNKPDDAKYEDNRILELVNEETGFVIGKKSKDIDIIFENYQNSEYSKQRYTSGENDYDIFVIDIDGIQIVAQKASNELISNRTEWMSFLPADHYKELKKQLDIKPQRVTNYPYSDEIIYEIAKNKHGVTFKKQYYSHRSSGSSVLSYEVITGGNDGISPTHYEIRTFNAQNFQELEKFMETVKLY